MKRYFFVPILLFMLILACLPAKRSNYDMTDGKRLFRAKCRSCHTLPNPRKYTDRQWNELVFHYGERINLSEEQKIMIVQYLIENNNSE